MKKLALLALTTTPMLFAGCTSERIYEDATYLEQSVVAELFGRAGPLREIDKRFTLDSSGVGSLFAPSDNIQVSDYSNEIYATMFVSQPDGRAYVNVDINNYDRMELDQPYTVSLDGSGSSSSGSSVGGADGPDINIYVCPENVSGPTGQSGDAQEVVVIREQGPGGSDVFTFHASADNHMDMALDGWFRSDPSTRY
jgi:hypothetical protein